MNQGKVVNTFDLDMLPFGVLPKYVWDFSGWRIVDIPYECSECNITFDCVYNRNKHVELVHP